MMGSILFFLLFVIVFGSLLLGSRKKDPSKRDRYRWVFIIAFIALSLAMISGAGNTQEISYLESIAGIATIVLALSGGFYVIDTRGRKAKEEFIIRSGIWFRYARDVINKYKEGSGPPEDEEAYKEFIEWVDGASKEIHSLLRE